MEDKMNKNGELIVIGNRILELKKNYNPSLGHPDTNLEDALFIGSKLNRAKALCKGRKGEFGRWMNTLESLESVKEVQFRRYMRIDRYRDWLSESISINGADRIIRRIRNNA
jgi:hypothetical protein